MSQNIPALTGLRFFAAMAIVFWHSQTGYFFAYGAFEPFFPAGAVSVFFVLSGFVLTIGADRYRSWSEFFVARVARVWPAHIAALVFLFCVFYPSSLYSFQYRETLWRLVLNVLLLQAWSPNPATYWSYNAPAWSVSCELFFYAMFLPLFAVLQRQTFVRTGLIAVVIFLAIVAVDQLHPGVDTVWLAEDNPVSSFSAFSIGVATGIWRRNLPDATIGLRWGTVIQALALASALTANAWFNSHVAPLTPGPAAFLSCYAAAPFYAMLLLALARYDGLISRALSTRVIVYGGEISYSIYLFHGIIIRWHSGEFGALSAVPIWLQHAGILIATFVIAAGSHHLIERPARRWILAGWSYVMSRREAAREAVLARPRDPYHSR
jgi:peptidoglycan/LPS O-acetylase OafA/YrhL